MNDIVDPITSDERVGFDQHGQLVCKTVDGDTTTWRFVKDVRDRTCAICAHGWELNGDSFSDQMGWSLIDEAVHRSCLIRHEALCERHDVTEALINARVRFELSPIDNQYWRPPDPWSKKPWYRARLLDHPHVAFVIGRRKRVFEVVVEGPCSWHREAALDFAAEQVTKTFADDRILVHAWGRDQLRAYVRRIAAIGQLCIPEA